MPRQVALELLCRAPGVRVTNRERKTFMRALEIHHVSTRKPRDERGQEILANRCQTRSISHLIKRHRRCVARRALVQAAYVIAKRRVEKLEKREGKPVEKEILAILFLQRQIAALEVKAKEIEIAWDIVTAELDRRGTPKLCATNANANANTGANS